MSAEYATRMETLRHEREKLTVQRQAIEKRLALREATAAEFSAVALQSYKQKWKTQRCAALAAKKNNDEFLRMLHDMQKQVHDTWSRLHNDQSNSGALLAQEKVRYNRKVEQIYPAWQDYLLRQQIEKLKALEDKKRAVERRRHLAKKSFEKEKMLDDLIRQARHEVEMAEKLEQNELCDRKFMRTRSENTAKKAEEYACSNASKDIQQAHSLEMSSELRHGFPGSTFSSQITLCEDDSLSDSEDKNYEVGRSERQLRVAVPTMIASSRSHHSEASECSYYLAEDIYEDDHIDENLRESSGSLSSTMTEGYQDGKIDYIGLQPTISKDRPAVSRFPRVSETAACVSRAAVACQALDFKVEQQRVRSNQQSTIEVLQHERPKKLITGKLFSIPESTELSETKSMVHTPGKMDICRPEATCVFQRENDSTANTSVSTESVKIFTTPTIYRENAFDLLSTCTSPTRTKEKQVANSPAACATAITQVNDTLQTRKNVDRHTENQTNTVDAESMLSEAIILESPASSTRDLGVYFGSGPQTIERSVEGLVEELRQESIDELLCKAAERPTPEEKRHLLLNPNNFTIPSDVSKMRSPTFDMELGVDEKTAENTTTDDRCVDVKIAHSTFTKYDIGDFHVRVSSESEINPIREGLTLDTTDADPACAAVELVIEPVRENIIEMASTKVHKHPSVSIPFTPPVSTVLENEDGILLGNIRSEEWSSSTGSVQAVAEMNQATLSSCDTVLKSDDTAVMNVEKGQTAPTDLSSTTTAEVSTTSTITEKLQPVDCLKALKTLISRVEDGASEGDLLGELHDIGVANVSKRELLKMAVGERKAQIAFFGSDICFELILDISRDIGRSLFPPETFEGIMNDEKICKFHQNSKRMQLEMWKTLSLHLKQLVQLKAISSAALVDLFVAAFLAHDCDNQRSQRKLRKYLVKMCEGGNSNGQSPEENDSNSSPSTQDRQEHGPKSASRIGTTQLSQTAFLERQKAPEPKVFGISSSSLKDTLCGSSDVLTSMSSGPLKLSQKLMRGGKMNDHSEFEEEEEVDLQNLIGPKFSSASNLYVLGRSYEARNKFTESAAKQGVVEEEDGFDADF